MFESFCQLFIKKLKIGNLVININLTNLIIYKENRLEAINLLLYGLIYAEDYVTQFLVIQEINQNKLNRINLS